MWWSGLEPKRRLPAHSLSRLCDRGRLPSLTAKDPEAQLTPATQGQETEPAANTTWSRSTNIEDIAQSEATRLSPTAPQALCMINNAPAPRCHTQSSHHRTASRGETPAHGASPAFSATPPSAPFPLLSLRCLAPPPVPISCHFSPAPLCPTGHLSSGLIPSLLPVSVGEVVYPGEPRKAVL